MVMNSCASSPLPLRTVQRALPTGDSFRGHGARAKKRGNVRWLAWGGGRSSGVVPSTRLRRRAAESIMGECNGLFLKVSCRPASPGLGLLVILPRLLAAIQSASAWPPHFGWPSCSVQGTGFFMLHMALSWLWDGPSQYSQHHRRQLAADRPRPISDVALRCSVAGRHPHHASGEAQPHPTCCQQRNIAHPQLPRGMCPVQLALLHFYSWH